MKESDPTKDPKFQKILQAFLHAKPLPHKPPAKKRRRRKPPSVKLRPELVVRHYERYR